MTLRPSSLGAHSLDDEAHSKRTADELMLRLRRSLCRRRALVFFYRASKHRCLVTMQSGFSREMLKGNPLKARGHSGAFGIRTIDSACLPVTTLQRVMGRIPPYTRCRHGILSRTLLGIPRRRASSYRMKRLLAMAGSLRDRLLPSLGYGAGLRAGCG